MRSVGVGLLVIGLVGCSGEDGAPGAMGANGGMGTMGEMGTMGQQGSQGPLGHSALINSTAEPMGNHCTAGGIKIEVGIDDNDNGLLDASEINTNATRYVCNGVDGGTSNVVTAASLYGNGTAGSPLGVYFAGSGVSTSAARADHDHDATYLKKGSALSCSGTDKISAIDALSGNVTCTADTSSGGTVTSVGAGTGLSGGPITTTGSLAIDTSIVPRLASANTFTASQTVAPSTGVALVVRGVASSAIQEWRDSSNTTRLSVDEYGVLHGGAPTSFPYSASFTNADQSGSVTLYDGYAVVTASASGFAHIGKSSVSVINFPVRVGTYLTANLMAMTGSDLVGETLYVIMGGGVINGGVNTGFGFKIVGNQLFGVSVPVSTESSVSLGSVNANAAKRLLAIVTSATTIDFFVDGVHAGTLSGTLPSVVYMPYRVSLTTGAATNSQSFMVSIGAGL